VRNRRIASESMSRLLAAALVGLALLGTGASSASEHREVRIRVRGTFPCFEDEVLHRRTVPGPWRCESLDDLVP
jgi:hypothetical protein